LPHVLNLRLIEMKTEGAPVNMSVNAV
ncbi:unnamed protein product, partial [Fusarium graminearum]